jgi:hypothetical protein
LLRTESDEGFTSIQHVDGDPAVPINIGFSAAPGAARETCATVTAVDVAGNATPFRETVCANVGADDGCTQASPGLGLGLLTLLRVRRRRRAA